MISEDELRQLSDHYGRQCVQISDEVAMTVTEEQDRHFRGGKACALSYLAEGYSKAAILEKAKSARGMFRRKLSRAEADQIFHRAIQEAFSEWDSRVA